MSALLDSITIAAPAANAPALLRLGRENGRQVRPVAPDPAGRFGDDAAGATVLWRRGEMFRAPLANSLATLPDLKWIHSDFVGVDDVPFDELAGKGITYTNGVGLHTKPIAEWIVLALLGAVKAFPEVVRSSDARRWNRDMRFEELPGKVVLFLGFGSIGQAAARLLQPFGLDLRAATRTRRESLLGVRMLEGEQWRDQLHEVDFLVLSLPATPQTLRLIDATVLARMKSSAWLINVARGSIVDEPALAAALKERRIGGALLDSFVTEPLPESSPLWGFDNVLVVPHWTWNSPLTEGRCGALFAAQLRRYLTGEALANIVEPARGY